MRAAADGGRRRPEAVRHRLAGGVRLVPAVRRRDRRRARHPGLVHDARSRAGMVVHTQTEKVGRLRRGVMELYISDHPLDCLTCSANGDCELQDMAGVTGLREVRYGSGVDAGANHLDLLTDSSNPYFDFDAVQVHRLLALRAGVRRGPGHLRADDRGSRLRLEGLTRRHRLPGLGVRLLRRVRAGLPDGDPAGEVASSSWACRPARSITTCAYCGVGCSFKAELRGDELVRMVPVQGRRRQRGPLLRQGPVRVRLRQPPRPRARPDGPRVRSPTSGARSSWDEAIGFTARRLRGDPGRSTASARSAAITSSRMHQRGGLRRPEDGAGGVRQQQRRHLRPGLPLADRATG